MICEHRTSRGSNVHGKNPSDHVVMITRATPSEIAESLAAAIAQTADRLTADLREGRSPRNDAEFAAEALIFAAFPLDVIVEREFGRFADEIRSTVRRRLFQALQRIVEGLPEAAMSKQQPDHLGRLAAEIICGTKEEIGVTGPFICVTSFLGAFNSFKGIGSEFEITGGHGSRSIDQL